MATMIFKRFTKTQVLLRIDRALLEMFFLRFKQEFENQGILFDGTGLSDTAYCERLAGLLLSPEVLPERLNEVLFALDEMACPEGLERLERVVADAGLDLHCPPRTSAEDLALRVWLAAPQLLARAHNELRMQRLSAFEHFGPASWSEPPLPPATPETERLDHLATALDSWFARHHRGTETTRVELYPILGESWFLIRHGDTFTRASAVEARKAEVIFFRPEKDDVAVYSPDADELRINARTRGERELYRAELGRFLRGDDHYFSERRTYTLEPLRREGAHALSTEGVDGLERVVLREIEVAWDNSQNEVTIRLADDLFHSTNPDGPDPIPHAGRLVRAAFDFTFYNTTKPRRVEIRLPNVLKVGRHSDARPVNCWTRLRHYRILPPGRPNAAHFFNR